MTFSVASFAFLPILLTFSLVLPELATAMTATPTSPNWLEVRERIIPELEQRLGQKEMRLGAPIFIRIFKESDELEIWLERDGAFHLYHTYTICDYSGTLGPKEREGDKQSPEGFYEVGISQLNPWSKFHLAFDLGYPNAYDRTLGRTGKSLMIHGRCSSVGCFAMTDYRMEEIYALADAALANGQGTFAVHIFPFRMTDDNMQRHEKNVWLPFWQNLKEGYDIFEATSRPPQVLAGSKRYTFSPADVALARQP